MWKWKVSGEWHGKNILSINLPDDNTVKAKLEVLKLEVRDIGGKSGIEQETLDTFISLIGEKVLEVIATPFTFD
jgi:hypothetical protein